MCIFTDCLEKTLGPVALTSAKWWTLADGIQVSKGDGDNLGILGKSQPKVLRTHSPYFSAVPRDRGNKEF